LGGAIEAAVVDDQDPIIDPPGIEIRRQAVKRCRQPFFFIEGGHDDCQVVIDFRRFLLVSRELREPEVRGRGGRLPALAARERPNMAVRILLS
jgi:hypothetical protein